MSVELFKMATGKNIYGALKFPKVNLTVFTTEHRLNGLCIYSCLVFLNGQQLSANRLADNQCHLLVIPIVRPALQEWKTKTASRDFMDS